MNAIARYVFAGFILTLGIAGCDGDAMPRTTAVFNDYSTSVTDAARPRNLLILAGLPDGYGKLLPERTQCDHILLLPVHQHTLTASPVLEECFPGGPFNENGRRKAMRRYLHALDTLDAAVHPGVRRKTDLLATIPLMMQYLDDPHRIREVHYLSDMIHDGARRSFAGRTLPFTRDTAADSARAVVLEHRWPADALQGVAIHVHLPGSASGIDGRANDSVHQATVKAFWTALFESLGARLESWQR